jgi:hypothetical protein
LLQLVREVGSRSWTTVSGRMDGRSDVQCRYHFMQLQRESRKSPHSRSVAVAAVPTENRPASPQEQEHEHEPEWPWENAQCTEFCMNSSLPISTDFFSW